MAEIGCACPSHHRRSDCRAGAKCYALQIRDSHAPQWVAGRIIVASLISVVLALTALAVLRHG